MTLRGAAFLLRADARALPLADRSVQCVVTSPPYWGLRDYGRRKQLGLEATPDAYVAALVAVFRELRRVLKDNGTVWLNLGDSYAGGGGFAPNAPSNSLEGRAARGARDCVGGRKQGGIPTGGGLKAKDLVMIPARVALALQADGWYLRSDIIWHKPNPMPESVTDRPTKAHEHLFLLSKSERYAYNADAIAELCSCPDGSWGRSKCYDADKSGMLRSFYGEGRRWKGALTRNKRTVWTIATQPYVGAHFATMPEKLVEPCLLAGSKQGDVCFDPFVGSGTVVAVAQRLGRVGVGVDLRYQRLAVARTKTPVLKGAA